MSDIKNIAVCLYGRFGTGEYCAPSILEFFETTHDVNVDFFCATKDYDNYYNALYENTPDNMKRLDISDLTTKLSVYNPKDTIIATMEEDKERRGFHPQSNAHLFSQIGDAIMLKSKYEVNNDIQYDVVFVTRYDILITHSQTYLDQYISWHNKEFDNKKQQIFGTISQSWMCASPMYNSIGHFTEVFKSSYQDMFFFGSSLAMDLVAANTLLLTEDQHYKTNKKTHIYPDINRRDGHEGLGYIFRKSNISVANCPSFDTDGTLREQFNGRTVDPISYTPVREFGEMNFPANSQQAFNRNCWIWCNDKPYTQSEDYIIELQTLIATCESDIEACQASTTIAKQAHTDAQSALTFALEIEILNKQREEGAP